MNYLSLFSGIGGFENGIEQSNIKAECVGFSEIDKYAKGIYQLHYPNHRDLGDATQIKTKELPEFEMLIGGFPCQAFSVAGKRKGFDDTRGTLFFEIARILKDKKPRYFLLENVRGLVYHDKGKTLQKILKILSSMDYWVEMRVFNSKNYGVPQNRERMFIIGCLRDGSRRKVFPFSRTTKKDNGLEMNPINKSKSQGYRVYNSKGLSTTLNAHGGGYSGKTGLYAVPDRKIKRLKKPKHSFNEVLSKEGISTGLRSSQGNKAPKIAIPVVTSERVNKRQNGRRFKENNDPMFTLTSCDRHGILINDNQKTDSITNYRIRKLTPIECERLQGFSSDVKEIEIWVNRKNYIDHQKNYVNVEIQNHKSQKHVGNVEKDKLVKRAKYVGKNLKLKNQQIKKLVQQNVHIHCEGKIIQKLNHKKSKSNVQIVEKVNLSHQQIKNEDFVRLNAGINIILKKIILSGKEELLQNEQYQIRRKNGKIVVELFGKDVIESVNCVAANTKEINKLLKFITSFHLDLKSLDSMIKTLLYYVINAIIGYIPIKTNQNCFYCINITHKVGYTEFDYIDGILKRISDSQRYKCLGNAVTTNVVEYIFNEVFYAI